MDENEKVKSETAKEEKKDKKNNKENPTVADRLKSWAKDIRGEFKKIIWPNKKELINGTVAVVFVSAIIGAVVCGLDAIFQQLFLWLVQFVGGIV